MNKSQAFVPCVLLLSLALPSAATAAVDSDVLLGRAQLDMSGMTFNLIDLDPDDGIAPSMTIDTSKGVKVSRFHVSGGYQEVQVPLDGFNSGPITITGPQDNQAWIWNGTQGTLSASTEFRLSDIDTTRTYYGSDILSNIQGWNITLSANTQLVFEGQAATVLSSDMASLVGTGLVSGPDRQFQSLLMTSFAGGNVILQDLDEWEGPTGWFDTYRRGQIVIDANGLNQTPSLGTDQPKSFSATFINATDAAKTKQLYINWSAGVSVRVTPVPIPHPDDPTPPIPEPGNLALVGVGLFVVLGRQFWRSSHSARPAK